jgi:peptidoglycan/LPS O-acetylase OafA/YrhL
VFRWMYWEDGRVLYYHTLSVMPDLLFGCLLAVYWDKNRVFFDGIKQVQKGTIRLVYALGILMILFKNVIFTENLVVFERYAIACFFCFVIVDQIQNERKISCAWLHKRLLFLGKISYGIYMYHPIIIVISINLALIFGSMSIIYLFSFIGTITVSHFSYKYFEGYFLRRRFKRNFR